MSEGKIIILTAPLGTGKSKLIKALVSADARFMKSISVTTRLPRLNEKEGEDHYFRTEKDMQRLIDNKELIECAKIGEDLYGTTKTFIARNIDAGKFIIVDIDPEGAKIFRSRAPGEVKSIFLMPPSMEELRRRIEKSVSNISEKEMEHSLEVAEKLMKHKDEYDYIVIDDDIDVAVKEIINIATS